MTPTTLSSQRQSSRDDRTDSPIEQDPRVVAIEAIVHETGCTPDDAERTLQWIQRFIDGSRKNRYKPIYPSTIQMEGIEYFIFDYVMPHGASARPGTAHQAIETALLDPARDEYALIHDQRDDVGSPKYCTVQVCLSVI